LGKALEHKKEIMIARSIFICLLASLLMSCQNTSTAQQSNEPEVKTINGTTAQVTKPPVAKALAAPVAHLKMPMEVGEYPFDIKLRDADGKEQSSSDVLKYEGKPTIVSFWLTTCGPCMNEFAAIKSKYEKWQGEADFKMVELQ